MAPSREGTPTRLPGSPNSKYPVSSESHETCPPLKASRRFSDRALKARATPRTSQAGWPTAVWEASSVRSAVGRVERRAVSVNAGPGETDRPRSKPPRNPAWVAMRDLPTKRCRDSRVGLLGTWCSCSTFVRASSRVRGVHQPRHRRRPRRAGAGGRHRISRRPCCPCYPRRCCRYYPSRCNPGCRQCT
jgi:hypothetical protein